MDRSGEIALLDPSAHYYLQDHRLDTASVLPAAMAMELMAEVVQRAVAEWQARHPSAACSQRHHD